MNMSIMNIGALNCATYISAMRNNDNWAIDELLHWVMIEAVAHRGERISINKHIKMSKMYLYGVKIKGSPKVYPFIDQNNKKRGFKK